MWKIGKKTQASHVGPRGKLGDASIKRAVDLGEQACGTCSRAEESDFTASIPAELTHSSTYMIEAERQRALAFVYARREAPSM